jgi:hypothetical protein
LPTINDASSLREHFGSASPFKVQVNFYIPIFEVQIDAIGLEKWLNLSTTFPIGKISHFCSLRMPPMSNISGILTMIKTTKRNLEYLGLIPLGTLLWMPSRNNITLLETTTTNT